MISSFAFIGVAVKDLDQSLEVDRVHVASEEVKHKPVTNRMSFDVIGQISSLGDATTRVRYTDAQLTEHNGADSVDDCQDTHHRNHVEPEPEKNIDLLVDNVDGQNAHGIMFLHIT